MKQGVDISVLRRLCLGGKIKWTLHALERIRERKILVEAVVNAVLSGVAIEQYQDDKPLPSCLICSGEKPLHVVVSTDGNIVYFITAYYPSTNEWNDDFITRR